MKSFQGCSLMGFGNACNANGLRNAGWKKKDGGNLSLAKTRGKKRPPVAEMKNFQQGTFTNLPD
jgi:hypothetical protein